MRISDWSSDVCSSDLMLGQLARLGDRGVDQLAGLVHRLDEAFLVRFGGVDQTPRIAPVGCGCDADEARQEPARRGFGYDPAPCEHKAIARGVAREPRIHRQNGRASWRERVGQYV